MRFFLTILSLFIILLSLFLYYTFYSFISYTNDKGGLPNPKYEEILKDVQGKNFINDNQKIFIVREFVLTDTIKTSGIVFLNGKKKNYKNKSLKALSAYNPEKAYITHIGDIALKGYIEINDFTKQGTQTFSNIQSKNKPKK